MKARILFTALVAVLIFASAAPATVCAADYRYSSVRSYVNDGDTYARRAAACQDEAERYQRDADRYMREAAAYNRQGKFDRDYRRKADKATDSASDAMRRCRDARRRAADAYRKAARTIED